MGRTPHRSRGHRRAWCHQRTTTLVRKNRATDLAALDALIEQRAIRTLLIGRPLHMDGTAGRSTHLAEQFGRTLAKRSGAYAR
ncbi:MAG: Holliday junction resolvase RuvX [Bryobacterales bacterium]